MGPQGRGLERNIIPGRWLSRGETAGKPVGLVANLFQQVVEFEESGPESAGRRGGVPAIRCVKSQDIRPLVVAKIIATPRPASVYRVAQGVQKLSVLLKKLLPGRQFEKMVGKHYK